jgi:hypothetical protein
MSVKTLNSAQPLVGVSSPSPTGTYSIAPSSATAIQSSSREALFPTPEEIDSFLDAENPLGCIRGVMWVMAFNAAVFMLGLVIWQSCKYLW